MTITDTTSNIEPRTSDPDLSRYHRQMLLPGFGETGQRKLLGATALVVGCGALGTVIANMLGRAGVGHLIIVDRDFIEMTNLQRQVLFDEDDVANAIPKAEAAKRKLAKINGQVKVSAVVDDVNHTNIEWLAGVKPDGSDAEDSPAGRKVDIIVDGVDNFETRYLANDCAVKHGIPYVYGGAVGTVGASYPILPHTVAPGTTGETAWEQAGKATPCLRCIFEQAPPPGLNPTCDTAGVIGPAVSIVANFEVLETLKILTGNLDAVSPTMLNLDLWGNTVRQFKVAKAYDISDCRCCHHRDFEFLGGKFASGTTTLCGRNAVQITQKLGDGQKLDFDEITKRLEQHGKVNGSKFMLRADIVDNGEPYELTLFTDGRAIVKGTKHATTAKSIYAKYVGA
ncbi:MAG: ThiF family adenylyltransferase [Phycisphaerales bacterium JB063]